MNDTMPYIGVDNEDPMRMFRASYLRGGLAHFIIAATMDIRQGRMASEVHARTP